MRRVVVTGMGIISPVGQTVETFWENVTAGRHGIAPISFLDTSPIFTAPAVCELEGPTITGPTISSKFMFCLRALSLS